MFKKAVIEVKCKCGHDIMMHGFHNMGCSVILSKIDDAGKQVAYKCPCSRFEKQI